LWLFLAAPLAHAGVNNFSIDSFSADYALTNQDRQGELLVTERIMVIFNGYNHGILRALPSNYKGHLLQLHVADVASDTSAPTQYSTYNDHDNMVIKIGDPDKTVTGVQEYIIKYSVRNVISFYPDHDELYWDINGDQWVQTAQSVSVNLHLPQGLQVSDRQPICYAGGDGSTAQDCSITYNSRSRIISAGSNSPLQSYQTLSIVAGFNKGYFHPSTFAETLNEHAKTIIIFSIVFLVLVIPSGTYWWRRGRDPKGRGVIVPEYGPPDNLPPILVGTIADFQTDGRDITATVIDMAIKGYIVIAETTEHKKIFKDINTFTLRLVNDDISGLNEFEKMLITALFPTFKKGQEVTLDELRTKLSETADTLRKRVRKVLLDQGYLRTSPLAIVGTSMVGYLWSALFFAGFVIAAIRIASVGLVVGGLSGAIVAAGFVYKSSSRTAKGVEAREHILGLKMYMEVAEAQRIKMLQGPNARYADKPSGPVYTVTLFEKLLPYAMVLGVEKQWAKQFESIYLAAPDWYHGNWATFNVLYMTNALNNSLNTQISSTFSAPSNASGSGFGGGGAGGGGGGGGGGGW